MPASMFVGRESERERILHRIQNVATGAPGARVLFLTGEAGIGKSSLLSTALADCTATEPAIAIASTACSTPIAGTDVGEVEALQPWADIIAQLADRNRDEKLQTRRLVADVAMAWIHCIPIVGDVLESVVDTARIVANRGDGQDTSSRTIEAKGQSQIFQQYINLLKEVAQRSPLVLVMDDAHWCDSSSVNLLFAAARQLQNERVLFIVAYRRDDALSTKGGDGHPIVHIHNELDRYSLCETVDLSGLSAVDLDHLLRSRYADYINNDPFEKWLSGIAGGNPLFITQYLQTLESEGYIDGRTATIQAGYTRASIPPSAEAVIQQRLGRLTEETRELLRYASVEGETFTSTVLARTSAIPQLRVLQSLRLVEESHHVVASLGRRSVYARETTAYRFIHLLFHQYLYNSLADEERLLIHDSILDFLLEEMELAIESRDRIPAIAIRISAHATVLQRFHVAAVSLLKGADALIAEYAFDEADRMIDQVFDALERIDPGHDSAPTRAEAHRLSSVIGQFKGDYARMLRHARLALDNATTGEARTAAARLETQALIYLEHIDEASEVAERLRMEAADAGDQASLSKALHLIARACMKRGQLIAAKRHLEECIDSAVSVGTNTITEADALNDLGIVLRRLGDLPGAETCYHRSLEIFERLSRRTSMATVLNNLGNIAAVRGDDATATQYFTDAIAISRAVGDLSNEAACLNNLGEIASLSRDYSAALGCYEMALKGHQLLGETWLEAMCMCNIGTAKMYLEEYGEAESALLRSLELYERRGDSNNQAHLNGSLAELHIRKGELDAARRHMERAWQLRPTGPSLLADLQLYSAAAEIELWTAAHSVESDRPAAIARAVEFLERTVSVAEEILPREVPHYRARLDDARRLAVTTA